MKCCMCAQAHRDGAHRGLVQSLGKGRVAAHATDAVARLNALLRQRGGELVDKRNDRQGVAAQRRGRLHVDVVAGDVPLLALGDGRRDQRVRAREQGLRDTQTSFHAALPFSAHRLALAWPPYGRLAARLPAVECVLSLCEIPCAHTSIVAVSFGLWPQGHLATGLPVPFQQSGGEQDSALSQSGELRVGQYSTPRAWKRLASAGSGVMPGSDVSLMRMGAHLLLGFS